MNRSNPSSHPHGTSSAPAGADTLLSVLAEADAAGYGAQLVATVDGCVRCSACDTCSPADSVEVDGARRLEGASDAADLSLVAFARCPACAAAGTIVLGYGPNASEEDVAVLGGLDLAAADPAVGLERERR